jgi:hypothetical protein
LQYLENIDACKEFLNCVNYCYWLWFNSFVGSFFLYTNILRLIFHDCGIIGCL